MTDIQVIDIKFDTTPIISPKPIRLAKILEVDIEQSDNEEDTSINVINEKEPLIDHNENIKYSCWHSIYMCIYKILN